MIIEFTNVTPPKGQSAISVAIVVATCAFFFIPTSLIVLGYLSSQPTGSLVSPIPAGVISQVSSGSAPSNIPQPSSAPVADTSPIIAAPNDSTNSAETVSQSAGSNIIDKTASISAGLQEINITDSDIHLTSQIYLSPRPGDKGIYEIKNKKEGGMVITTNSSSDTVRYIDYHIVNP